MNCAAPAPARPARGNDGLAAGLSPVTEGWRLLRRAAACALLLWVCLGLAACSSIIYLPRSGGGDTASGPRGKPYTVRGKTYRPLLSAEGFREEGVASWYGRDFHGKKTANGEIYNMYAMTAAHKILPLGVNVRVTHLANGRSIVVRVNDRGPFVDGRVIDLSYTAATKLNMIGSGTARVRIEALSGARGSSSTASTSSSPPSGRDNLYIQIASLRSEAAAKALVRSLQLGNFGGRTVYEPARKLWRVQAGPFSDLGRAESAVKQLLSRFPGCYVVRD